MNKENSIATTTNVNLSHPLIDTEVLKYGEKVNKERHTPTEQEKISYRKGKAGKEFKYIKKEDCWDWLDSHYPVNSYEIDTASVREIAGFFYVKGILSVYVTELGIFRKVESWGCDEIEFIKGTKDAVAMMYLKNAETDALKRCCVKLGAFNDVYSDIEVDKFVVSDEDFQWYIDNILDIVVKDIKEKKLKPRSLFMQIRMFYSGKIDKEELYKHYYGG